MKPIVLLPSLGRPCTDFDELVARLEAEGRMAVALDLPGVGGAADRPAGGDLHAIAADVVARLSEISAPFHLVGHAFGNRVARCLAADRPELVASLILLGCGGKVPGDEEAQAALLRCFTESPGTAIHEEAVATAFFAPGNRVPPSWQTGWWPAGAREQGRASQATPLGDWWLPPAPLPVLALVGASDRISPPANAEDLIAQVGERGRLRIITGAGHALLPEQPKTVAEELIEALRMAD
jgi:pimeloyl-ACP methyl ester carboxylesterase